MTTRRIVREGHSSLLASLDTTEVAHEFLHGPGTRRRTINQDTAPFVAWDGEGITPPGQSVQNFVLFGNSAGDRILGYRLGSRECLQLIIDAEKANPAAIHVGFSFSYDTEMILADLDEKHLRILRTKGSVKWSAFRIEYRRGKWLQVTKIEDGTSYTARIWDVFSFYGTSFLVAVREYLGDVPDVALLEQGKSTRGEFTYADLDSGFIQRYWELELRLTVLMMDTLRTRLYDAGLKIRQWHGPGAISSYTLKTRKMGRFMDKDIPAAVNDAAQFAYAGGRFELFQVGRESEGVHSYDIRSAYPSAIAQLPNLANGEWVHVERPTSLARFGLYHIRFAHPTFFTTKPMPYFYRSALGLVDFPNQVEGWYWTPEAELASIMGDSATIVEGFEFHDDGTRPFDWVEDIYETRAQWKREGNPSQIALKLLLNSMYGKLAQRVGYEKSGKIPQWHQLEWAGWVTSHARARLFHAMILAAKTDSLIGVETDGIFTRTPLPLDVGPGLGQWEHDYHDEMIYLQSGFYFRRADSKWTAKYRGFDKGSITVDHALRALEAWKPWEEPGGKLTGTTTRFASMGAYLARGNVDKWRNKWVTEKRILSIGSDGKRIHRALACQQCDMKASPADVMHSLTITRPLGGTSVRHSLPWVEDAPENPYREQLAKEWGQ